jgi:ABC-type polar amino acid transport system ATPase subunit
MSMIEIKSLYKSFGDHEVLKGIDQNVEEGEVLCIVGPSGSGKSTMLRCINRLEEPTKGEIYSGGELVAEKNLDTMRTRMGMVFQSFNLFPHKTVLENLTIGPVNVKKADKKESEMKGMALLERVGLSGKENSFPRELSGGQKQRVAIVRALCMHPEILLFDEVTAALDPEMVREVLDVVLELARQGRTMLIVTHEMQFARAIADRIIFIDSGKIVDAGK